MNGVQTLISLGLDLDQVINIHGTILDHIPLCEWLYDASGVNFRKHQSRE
jgi:hypothetical protein